MSDPLPDVPQVMIVVTTVASEQDAASLAAALIDSRLAACVQIEGQVQSHYEWQSKREVAEEFRLAIKAPLSHWERLRQKLRDVHPYETPEILMTRVDEADEAYRRWVHEQTS